jgi:glutamyl-tRNA synthetase
MSAPRVRFAPSPTGELHVGSARTSLFNWLFARQRGGTFILRIEDTDTERNRAEWVEGIVSALSWLGMDPDEGPILQSSRFDRYRVAIDALWASGALYACDCTRQDVDARTKGNPTPGYDGHCSERGLARGEGRALRFRTPTEGTTLVRDLVRGDVTFPHASMEDFVCVKSTGQPLFVLANVVDDRDMSISHVIRGEDLLPTTPKGVLVWQALDAVGGEAGGAIGLPVFAHLPMLVNAQRKKLSKRDGHLAVEAYRDQGYLAEAFRNYLALLGWSPPGQEEKVDVDTLIREFALEDVHHAPAFFDAQKLAHLNGEYIREMPVADFVTAAKPWVAPDPHATDGVVAPPAPWPPERFDPDVFAAMAPLVQERVTVLEDVPAMVDFLFRPDPVMDPDGWQRVAGDAVAREILSGAIAAYETCEWSTEALRDATIALWGRFDISSKRAQAPIRVAVTGRTVGPPLFEPLELLGRDEVLRRLRAALERLGSP